MRLGSTAEKHKLMTQPVFLIKDKNTYTYECEYLFIANTDNLLIMFCLLLYLPLSMNLEFVLLSTAGMFFLHKFWKAEMYPSL